MERCNQPDVGNTQGGMNKEAAGSVGGEGSPWELPHIAELIDEGQITIGVIRPVGKSVAVANDGETTLAMLVRKEGETLLQLLTRLDLAVAKAQTEDIFTDEINPRPSQSRHS